MASSYINIEQKNFASTVYMNYTLRLSLFLPIMTYIKIHLADKHSD